MKQVEKQFQTGFAMNLLSDQRFALNNIYPMKGLTDYTSQAMILGYSENEGPYEDKVITDAIVIDPKWSSNFGVFFFTCKSKADPENHFYAGYIGICPGARNKKSAKFGRARAKVAWAIDRTTKKFVELDAKDEVICDIHGQDG